jgi:NAD-dependent DNA ligase
MATSSKKAVDLGNVELAVTWGLLKSLRGKSFCMTGTMSAKRAEMEKLITLLGGSFHDAVRQGTDYLIIPDYDTLRAGSKYDAATRLGKVILTEEEFCGMILPTLDELLGGSDGTGRGKA